MAQLINDHPGASASELAAKLLSSQVRDLSLTYQYRLLPPLNPVREALRLGVEKAIRAIQRGTDRIIPDSPDHVDIICLSCPVVDPGYCNKRIVRRRLMRRRKAGLPPD